MDLASGAVAKAPKQGVERVEGKLREIRREQRTFHKESNYLLNVNYVHALIVTIIVWDIFPLL